MKTDYSFLALVPLQVPPPAHHDQCPLASSDVTNRTTAPALKGSPALPDQTVWLQTASIDIDWESKQPEMAFDLTSNQYGSVVRLNLLGGQQQLVCLLFRLQLIAIGTPPVRLVGSPRIIKMRKSV